MLNFSENIYPYGSQSMMVDELIFSGRSAYQDVLLFWNQFYGRVLVLDGVLQLTERDEFIYSEMMAHVLLFAHPDPASVLIIGGGDGCVLEEVLKHKAVRRALMVDIDGLAVDLCRRHFAARHGSAFEDPRLELRVADGIAYVRDAREKFDLILVDGPDQTGAGEAGRLRTVMENGEPLYEAGGEWIDADHYRVISLLKDFGLNARSAGDSPGRIDWQGRLMSEAEISAGSLADEMAVESLARDLCRELRAPVWENTHAAEFDRQTLASFKHANARSDQGHFQLIAKYRSDEGDDLDQIGLLGWLAGYQLYAGREGGEMCAYHLPVSSQELCARTLSTLNAAPSYGRALKGLRQERCGVTLFFNDGAVKVDRVALTLPPRCLEKLWFDPPLRPEQFRAIRACRMGRAVKICWQFDRPWWREEGWNGSLLSDGPLQHIWEASIGEAPILCAFVCGKEAIRWQRMRDPVLTSLEALTRICPAAGRTFMRGWFHDWINDPFAQGVYSHMQPGYVLDHLRFIATPFDRVHFAGEHTATWSGFMEGALESAERVAHEMIGAE